MQSIREPAGREPDSRLGHLRLTFLAAVATVFLLVPVAQAVAATITIEGAGTGDGTVTTDKGTPPINCAIAAGVTSGDCVSTVPAFDTVTITATEQAGSEFVEWGGNLGTCTGSTNPCQQLFFGAAEAKTGIATFNEV
ncbi:MAG TPA: hypothetical protein VFT19_05740, partial [Solirubrobacterales bacterium]|nr:hypothetical protein [Solirubrobacterales bacterium]